MNFLKQILKSFIVAFSLYSKVPMPRFVWNSGDMKYHFIFFPFVGVLIGALEFVWKIFQLKFGFGGILYLCIAAAIPLIVTGGIHFDGFMDTTDALCSYAPKEKKLEILKDPHIGAFAVIGAAVYFLLLLGFGSEVKSFSALICVCFSFVFSRILTALGVVFLKKAKADGMAKTEAESSAKKTVGVVLALEFVFFSVLLVFILPRICGINPVLSLSGQVLLNSPGALLLSLPEIFSLFLALAFSGFFCFFTAKKNFGGITGDTAGFFVSVSELLCVVSLSICGILKG